MPESQLIKTMDEIKKKVDDNWKQNVDKEKQEPKAPGELTPPEPDFKFFITTLALQTSIALGHMANPATGKIEEDPAQAKFLIDTIAMLQEKTKGNLNQEEAGLVENLLYELRVAYLAKEEKPAK
ncbi:MAG: hypothetical protein COV73_05280 [Candidatus Omnitrophica bacterium CG11_big_fil_rev_8_21_14_0_20_43_6]|nr:MAG: hypothetical protein COV73_05280 [Candidatus Omnitrophica bacterium CG11_big_fil_rev_8_21_14_0_20_43_6]